MCIDYLAYHAALHLLKTYAIRPLSTTLTFDVAFFISRLLIKVKTLIDVQSRCLMLRTRFRTNIFFSFYIFFSLLLTKLHASQCELSQKGFYSRSTNQSALFLKWHWARAKVKIESETFFCSRACLSIQLCNIIEQQFVRHRWWTATIIIDYGFVVYFITTLFHFTQNSHFRLMVEGKTKKERRYFACTTNYWTPKF